MMNRVRIAYIQEVVAQEYGVTVREMVSNSRRAGITEPRYVAMFLARILTGASLAMIGRSFRRDHTTVIASIRRAQAFLSPARIEELSKRVVETINERGGAA